MSSSLKRLFDWAGAAAGLLVFSPVLLLIAVAILLDDGRPVLFRQARVGRGRRPFDVLKFRSMRDGEVTRVGARLRRTGLDELPQFINVLRGEMSAVGPRPLTTADVTRLGWDSPACAWRWDCRPGLTGLAQLAGTSASEALALDRYYVARWRPLVDVRVIAWSFAVNVFGKRRVRGWVRRLAIERPLRAAGGRAR